MNTPNLITASILLAAAPAFAQDETASAPRVIRVEVIQVVPDPQDREPPQPTRWERFAAALGPGRSAHPRTVDMRFNDGSRAECRESSLLTDCERSGQFSLVGNRTWTGR